MSPAKVPNGVSRGWIVPVGGAEDKVKDPVILRRFVGVSGGAEGRIAVIPTASEQAETGGRYEETFRQLGAATVVVLDYQKRSDAERDDLLEQLDGCTGVFFTGGNQLRISTILGGTKVAKAVRRLNAQGVAVGGTSAGAAILSEHMIAFGKTGGTPRAGMVTLAPGFGMTNRVVIDQHFRQRDRLGRLLTALAYNPFAVGLGLDENTAAFIDPEDLLEVAGTGAITIVDPSEVSYTSMDSAERHSPVCVLGLRLHVLVEGATYNIRSREAAPPAGARAAARRRSAAR